MAEFDGFKAERRRRRPNAGRHTKYHPDFNQEAFRACLNGSTDEELAYRFNISTVTLYVWKKRYPEFTKAINDGKEKADDKIAEALYKRALGYSHPAVKFFLDTKGNKSVVIREEYTEHYPPDYPSIRLWLLNRRRHVWKDNSDVTVHKSENEMSDDELIAIALRDGLTITAPLDNGDNDEFISPNNDGSDDAGEGGSASIAPEDGKD